jgi:hypothetical protein
LQVSETADDSNERMDNLLRQNRLIKAHLEVVIIVLVVIDDDDGDDDE